MLSIDSPVMFLIAVRVSGLLLLAPGMSGRSVPVRWRAAMVLVLSLLIAPGQAEVASDWTWGALMGAAGGELLVGLALGLSARMLIVGAQSVGQLVGSVLGWSGSDGGDVAGDAAAPLARFLEWTAIAVYLTIGGQRQLISVLLESYDWFPLGMGVPDQALTRALTDVLTQACAWSFRLSAPILAATLSATLVTGLLQRALPQLDAFTWSASLNTLLVFALLSLSLGSLGVLFPGELESAWNSLRAAQGR